MKLRRFLVEDSLVAVVSLPAGVFKPYSGVKTSILLLDKKLARHTKEILFLKITADGFDLGDKRNPIEANDLPEAERVVKLWLAGKLCVTVGMMTTGYDCEDVLNVVLARPIFSPTDFIQIKGRGTRLYTFKHDDTGRSAAKDGFALFDFFANCEFFEEEFDYDEKLKLPQGPPTEGPGGNTGGTGGSGKVPETYTNTSPDPLKEVAAEAIGKDGMKIDREMYRQRFASQAQEAAAAHPDLREAVASENWPAAESIVARLLMNKPTEFWNLLKLQEIFRSDRTPSLREILQVIFGLLPGVATREQVAGEHFERYLATQPVDATKLRESRQVFLAYVLDGMARSLIEAGDFAGIRARDAALYQSLKALGADGIAPLRTYIAANVPEADLSAVA